MTWLTSVSDLRAELSDGPTDKFRSRIAVFGTPDGNLKTFKTLEIRRLTDFTNADVPLGVYVNDVLVDVDTDYPEVGEFTLKTAPIARTRVVANYYLQWFLDSELQLFLKNATQWLGSGSDVTMVPDGLQPAVLQYACHKAYQKLSLRWAELISTQYRLEDQPDAIKNSPSKLYSDMAQNFLKVAQGLREGQYTRQDQAKAPLFASIRGSVRDTPPRT